MGIYRSPLLSILCSSAVKVISLRLSMCEVFSFVEGVGLRDLGCRLLVGLRFLGVWLAEPSNGSGLP